APLLLEPYLVESRCRQRLDAADVQIVKKRAAGKATAVNLKCVGVKGELLEPDELLEVNIGSEVDPVLVCDASLRSACRVAQNLSDIGHREFDALLLKWVRQETQCFLLDGALAGVGIGRLEVVCLLIFLRKGIPRKGRSHHQCQQPGTHPWAHSRAACYPLFA